MRGKAVVTLLIILYALVGALTVALVMRDNRRESYLEVSYLALSFLFWPVMLIAMLFAKIETPAIRNPFWHRGTP